MDAGERFAALSALPFEGRRNGGPTGTRIGAIGQVGAVFRQRALLGLLVRRDLKARYKDSALGFLWALAKPLTQIAIYYIVIGHFLGAARGIPDFAIYVFTGLTVYMLFSQIVSGATGSILANAGLVKKVAVPRELYPLASVGGALFDFAIQVVVLIFATIVVGAFPWTPELLMAIPAFLLLLVYATAIGLALAAINVFLRDIGYLIDIVLMVLMWMSPILYSWGMVRDTLSPLPGGSVLVEIYTNNPVTLAVLGFQRAFWTAGHDMPSPPDLLLRIGIALVIGILLLVVGHWVFRRLQGNFAQEL